MHIVAYLTIITVNALQIWALFGNLRAFEITIICLLAVYSICNAIFGLILNQIVTKIQAITSYSESIAHSLMTAAVASDLVNQARLSLNNS